MLRRLPWRSLTIKVTAVASLLGLLLWLALDHYQTASTQRVLQDEFERRLDYQAHQNRLRFDRVIRRHFVYARIAAQAAEIPKSVSHHIEFVHEAPAWLPERAIGNALILPDFLLIIDRAYRARTAYLLGSHHLPFEIPEISARLVAGSRQEPLLQLIDGRLFLFSTAEVPRPDGGWVMAVSVIDDDFLELVQGALHGHSVTAVVGGEDLRILASGDRTRLPIGLPLSAAHGNFLVTGKGFFDYGFAEAHAGFVTLVSRGDLAAVNGPIIAGERNQRTILAIALTTFFALMLLYVAYRLRRLASRVTHFMEHALGSRPQVDGHLDELDRLEQQVEYLTREVVAHRDALAEEAEKRLDNLHDNNQRLEAIVEIRTHELRQALNEAEKAVAAKGRFLAAASHDLRQPFQAMRLFLDTLIPALTEARARDIAERLDEAMRGGEELLSALLRVSSLDAGMVCPTIEPVVLDDVLAQVFAECEIQAVAKGLSFRRLRTSAHGMTDRVMLTRILRNLVVNAIRYTAEGGIVMGVRRHGAELAVVVADTGIGVPEDKLPLIFDDFYQVGNSARDRSQGLGLGLSVVMREARLLGHSVDVASRHMIGTTFTVRLAAATEKPQRAEALNPAF